MAGRTGKCPKCGARLTVPAIEAESPINIDTGKEGNATNDATLSSKKMIWSEPAFLEFPWLVLFGVIGLVAWVATLRTQPSPLVLVHYGGLVLACCGFIRLVSYRWQWLPTKACTIVLVVSVVSLWSRFDTYVDRWTSKNDLKYRDTVCRWSHRVTYRSVFYDHNGTIWSLSGPIAGSGVKHGEWSYYELSPTWYSSKTWYWYGQEISEGEWHLRNK